MVCRPVSVGMDLDFIHVSTVNLITHITSHAFQMVQRNESDAHVITTCVGSRGEIPGNLI